MLRFGRGDWKDGKSGEEQCFLLTNGLGGYCSLTLIGSNTRDDHAFFMGVEKAPNFRYHYLTNLQENLEVRNRDFDLGSQSHETYDLASQSYVTGTRDQQGYRYLQMFSMEELPEWVFLAGGITIRKQIVMKQGENTVGVRYEVDAPQDTDAVLRIRPLLKFAGKNKQPSETQEFIVDETAISSDGKKLFYRTNGVLRMLAEKRIRDLYFSYDDRDGRDAVGTVVINHEIVFEIKGGKAAFEISYSDHFLEETVEELIFQEKQRLKKLEERSGLKNPAALRLVRSADQFLVKRDSTGGDTIIAGYPFFGDWGRDTMIAVMGCAIASGQFERAKSILNTFASYCKKGLMPNLFPEGEDAPLYNTVDAALWFIQAVYEYGKVSEDQDYVLQMLPVMEDIAAWYQRGTDFHIYMDEDGLISAGDGLEQVTWMDVRFEDILPTPRHGKPVEVNALWYNGLCILSELSEKGEEYKKLAEKVKKCFIEKFWMEEKGYLKDVLAQEEERRYSEEQIRCNQIWALSLPYSMLEQRQAIKVLETLERELYTPYGLRSLSPTDSEFHPVCKGDQFHRDMAYHQGTVWGFPLGAYLKALLYWEEPEKGVRMVKEKLKMFETSLREGCIGQCAEIYDGEFPTESRGCYAQAWSVGEMLAVYRQLENQEAGEK